MNRHRHHHAFIRGFVTLVAAACLASVGGCAIQPDAQPRDVADEDRGVFGDQATGDEATGTSLIFLLAPNEPDEPQLLRSAMRDVPSDASGKGTVSGVMRSLLSGPNAAERDDGIDTAIPPDLVLNADPRTLGRISTIDVSDALDELDAVTLRYAIAQIVATVTSVEGVEAVQIRVNGESRVWPRGDGELTASPLMSYDYPGLVESTQPPYPAIPSGFN